jgi:RNA polymerase sigma-70 factor (ECF subfamily)
MASTLEPSSRSPSRRVPPEAAADERRAPRPHLLKPDSLSDHVDRLYRAAWALCGSREDAEDLVQETFVNVLRRPRFLRDDNEIGYLMRALRNTHANRHRAATRRPRTGPLFEDDVPSSSDTDITAAEIMRAIASAPPSYRDAVIAVDLVGLSYRQAARSLRTREATIATRVHRGRRHVAGVLSGESL